MAVRAMVGREGMFEMRIWSQLLIATVALGGGLVAVAHGVPATRPVLERAGVIAVMDRLGIAPASEVSATAVSGPAAGGPPAGAGPGSGAGAGAPGGGRPGGAGGAGGPGGGAVVVGMTPVPVPLTLDVAAIGTGMALRSVALRPEVAGRLAELSVGSGARVEAGQVLARLEAGSEDIALMRARLLLADAQGQYDRVTQLRSAGSASEIQRATAELALRQAELALRQAEFELERREIRSPIDGTAGIVELGVGDQIATQDVLVRIDDRTVILVDFTVPERFVGRIASGDTVAATPLARPELSLSGIVQAVENRVDPESRAIRVQAAFRNEEDLLRAGMAFAIRMQFQGETYPAVDPLAIQWSAEGAFVWVAREGRALRVPVRIVQRSASTVLVDAEFAPGDVVVTEGVQALRPNGAVTVRGAPPRDAAAEAAPPQRG